MPNESTLPTYVWYFHVVPSKFVCANSNFQNEFPFCVPVPLMKQQGVDNIFHARCVILKMIVYSLVIARERAGNRDAQSHDPKRSNKINIIKENSPRVVVSWRHSLFRASHGLMLVGGWGSINLYHSVWELPIMHVVWNVQPSHSCYVDSESMPLKMLFNLYFKIELWHLYKSLLPSVKGLSI